MSYNHGTLTLKRTRARNKKAGPDCRICRHNHELGLMQTWLQHPTAITTKAMIWGRMPAKGLAPKGTYEIWIGRGFGEGTWGALLVGCSYHW